jgi:acetyltransferase-like isoleucine patch superfamily enzyme
MKLKHQKNQPLLRVVVIGNMNMKLLLKKLISLLNKLILILQSANFKTSGNSFYLFKITSTKNNIFAFENTEFVKSRISVCGMGNIINTTHTLVSDTTISITGEHNKIILNDGVHLRGANIIIRGNHCSITVGRNTTFGGVRIVNVGTDCAITIGEGCLFADHVELWSSDTHPIYNNKKEIINHEAPITIGDKVWVGSHVIVLKGVSVGDGSIIGMGTLVTKDIPSHVISVGNPNRTVKEDITWSLNYYENDE